MAKPTLFAKIKPYALLDFHTRPGNGFEYYYTELEEKLLFQLLLIKTHICFIYLFLWETAATRLENTGHFVII